MRISAMTRGDRVTAQSPTRDIARAAVRAELAQVAFGLFWQRGFDQVTIADVAAAAGVSRSTFLRYFDSKEDAVLCAFDAQRDELVAALRQRPAEEDNWTALRRALDIIVTTGNRDPAGALNVIQLIEATPALRAWLLEKQHAWRRDIAATLAQRPSRTAGGGIALAVQAAAALGCLNVALDRWTESEGRLDLGDLLDEAFAALAPR